MVRMICYVFGSTKEKQCVQRMNKRFLTMTLKRIVLNYEFSVSEIVKV